MPFSDSPSQGPDTAPKGAPIGSPNDGPPARPSAPVLLITTWFGSGLSPIAPGTMGSLAALPPAWLLVEAAGPVGLFWGIMAVLGVGFAASHLHMVKTGETDPPSIVIDEVAGQWITLLIAPLDPMAYLAGFLLFRFFDIAKVWPANWIDRSMPGALGVMLDDVVAGVFGLGALALVVSWPMP